MLKAIPVEIVTAAITTTRDGGVYDVFQVTAPQESAAAVSLAAVRACVQQVLEEHHTGAWVGAWMGLAGWAAESSFCGGRVGWLAASAVFRS